jgi:TP901 family phage tail tape measure protein
MKDYGLTTLQTADAANFLVSVVSQGKTHMVDLAASMASILPTASGLHIPLAQIGGAMASITARGVPAADAATQLRFTLMALVSESTKGSKALTHIGTSAKEVRDTLTTKGLLPAIQLVNDKLMKAFPTDVGARVAAMTDIFGGKRGLAGALQITGQNLGDFIAAAASVSGAVDKNHGKVMGWALVQQDLNEKLDRAKGALGAFGIELGQRFLPIAGRILDWALKFMPNLAALLPALDGLAKAFASGQWAEGLAVFVENWIGGKVGNKLAQDIWGIDEKIRGIIPSLKRFWDGLMAIWNVFVTLLKPILKEISKHGEAFRLVLEALGIMVLIVVGIILGLVLAFALVVLSIGKVIDGFQHDMKPAFDDVNNVIVTTIGFVKDLVYWFGVAANAFSNLPGSKDIANAVGIIQGLGGGSSNRGGNYGRAGGGQILAGWSGWVGEKGPEYVTAGGPANVHNAADSKRMGGVSLTVNNYGGVTDPEAIRRTLQRMAYLGAV